MAAGLQLPSMFLVCLLSLQASDSLAFPRVSSSGYTETRQGLSKKPQEGYGFGNRRHQARSDGTTDWSQSYTQPSQHRQELAPHHFPQHSPTLSSHPRPKPRGFAFNIKVPLAKTPNKKHVTGGGTKDTDLASGFQSTYRPTSVQIHSSFNRLPSSAGSSPKGSASDLNRAQSTHEASKPHFQLSFSVPIPPSSTSEKPSSGKGFGFAENQHGPSSASKVQSSYLEQEQRGSGPAQSVFPPSSGFHVHEGEQRPKIPTEHTPPAKFISDQISHGLSKPGMTQHPALSLMPPQSYPLPQYEYTPSGYYGSQFKPTGNDYGKGQSGQTTFSDPTNAINSMSPTFASLQYEKLPSGHYSAGQLKPSGSSDGKGQNEQTAFPFSNHPYVVPEQYNYVHVHHPISPLPPLFPTLVPSQYEQPSFEHHRMEIATSANYLGKGDIGPTEQMDITQPIIGKHPYTFPSFFPYQHIEGQKGQSVSPDPLIVGDSPPHYPDVPSAYHQIQMQLPTHYTGKEPFDGKHPFTKLVIEAEPEMNNFNPSPQPDGQHTEFGRLVPSTYLSHQLESHLFGYSSNSGDHEDGQYENYPQKQADTEQTWYSYPMPEQTNLASYTGTYASSVPTYFDQTQQGKTSEPTFKPMPDYFGTSQYGQYPNSYLQEEQHASNYGQTIENLYGYNPLFQQGPSSFNPAEGLTVGHRAPANAPQITKYPSSVAQSSTQEPAFELNIAVPIDISSSKNTDTPPPQSHSHFLASSTELHQHNTSRNGDFIPISHPGNATLQASQYTLPTKPLSPQPQQQSQSVSEVHPPHSAHSSSSNSYPFQFGSPISLKPFVSDYSVVPPSGQHFQQAAGMTKPLQSLQPSYQDSTSHSGGFAQVTSPLNPGTQTSHSPASIGGGYSYGGGFAFGSLQSGHMPSSHSIPVGGEHSLTHQYTHHGHGTVDSGGYKPSSGPKQSMAQDVFNHGYKPSTW